MTFFCRPVEFSPEAPAVADVERGEGEEEEDEEEFMTFGVNPNKHDVQDSSSDEEENSEFF